MQKDNQEIVRKLSDFLILVVLILLLGGTVLLVHELNIDNKRIDSQCTYIHNLTDLTNRESILINYAYNKTIQPIPYYCGG